MSNTTKKDALKAIVEALGESSTAKTDKDIIFEIAEAMGGSDSGGGVFTFNATYDGEKDRTTTDKTYGEIYEAFSQGMMCMCLYDPGNGDDYYTHTTGLVTAMTDSYDSNTEEGLEHLYTVVISEVGSFNCTTTDSYPYMS